MRIPKRESSPSPDDREEWLVADERSKVETWRIHVLTEAGYPFALAQRISMSAAVDLHVACEMLTDGCTPEMAAEILL